MPCLLTDLEIAPINFSLAPQWLGFDLPLSVGPCSPLFLPPPLTWHGGNVNKHLKGQYNFQNLIVPRKSSQLPQEGGFVITTPISQPGELRFRDCPRFPTGEWEAQGRCLQCTRRCLLLSSVITSKCRERCETQSYPAELVVDLCRSAKLNS